MATTTVHFSVSTYDLEGSIELAILPGQEGIGHRSRRSSVVETLDGGASLSDNGPSILGSQLTLKLVVSTDQARTLRHLIETYPVIEMVTEDGFFTVAPSSLAFSSGVATFVVSILTKEAN